MVAGRWLQSYEAGVVAPVVLASTHERALEIVPIELLTEALGRRTRRTSAAWTDPTVYDDWPAGLAFAFLFAVAFCRGGATYAIARGLRGLAARRSELVERPSVRRAEAVVSRYGAPAVTLCFLTIGVQTAVNAAAGSLRMPLPRYLPALAVGAALWATIYVTIGIAVLRPSGVGRRAGCCSWPSACCCSRPWSARSCGAA